MLEAGTIIVVKGPGDDSPTPPGARSIVINPTEAFGIGYEPTTRTFIEDLEILDLTGLEIADIGTGTGILALAAIAMGANHVYATDIHPHALESARANIASNGFGDRIDLTAETFPQDPPPLDIIVSNVGRTELIAEVMDWGLTHLKTGGLVWVMPPLGDHVMVQAHAVIRGLSEVVTKVEGQWAFQSFEKG